MWATHRCPLPRLPWRTQVCPGEDRAQSWHGCLGQGSSGGNRCMGKPTATGVRDSALLGAFSSAQQQAHNGHPWWSSFLVPGGQGPVCGEREAAMAAPPSACYSTVVPCFHGSPGLLHRHSMLWISSLPSSQVVSSQPTAVLPLGLLSNPHTPSPSPHAHR